MKRLLLIFLLISGLLVTSCAPAPTVTSVAVLPTLTPKSVSVSTITLIPSPVQSLTPTSTNTPTLTSTVNRIIALSVDQNGIRSNYSSNSPAISGNGRSVVFSSGASNLVPDDTNGKDDIFVQDLDTRITTRVSVSSDGTQGNDFSEEPSISGDGRYVVFWSYASNLVPGDTNDKADIFVHDRNTELTTRVSVASDGTQSNGHSFNSISISKDGNYIAFMSQADNLVAADTNKAIDVFVHNLVSGETARVSVASNGTQSNADAFITRGSISGDARYITFMSGANNLVLPDTNNFGDVFVRDVETGITSRVSVSSDGTQGNSGHGSPLISGNGRYIVFSSLSSNLVPDDTNNIEDIFIHDREMGTTSQVSLSSDGTQSKANEYSYINASVPWSISDDGGYVAFTSEADNLAPDDTNQMMDVYVRDIKNGVTTWVSVASDGTASDNPSYSCAMSGDGKYIVFKSFANNLVPNYEHSIQEDIFLYENKN